MNSLNQTARNLSDCEDLDSKIKFMTRFIESGHKKPFKSKEKKLETTKTQEIDLHKFAFDKFLAPKNKTGFTSHGPSRLLCAFSGSEVLVTLEGLLHISLLAGRFEDDRDYKI